MDLQAYFKRIGYDGGTAPTLVTLNALTAAHAMHVPFENVDVLLRRPIVLDGDALFHKIVTDHRGGYCFEQNGLFLDVLRTLGFDARPLGARVRLGVEDRAQRTQRTHMLIAVTLGGAQWLTDVGVGAATLTGALRLVPDVEQATPHETRRLQHESGRWYHQILRGGAWSDVYEFALDDFPLVDRQLANWYTSTAPASHFHANLTAAIARPDGRRVTLSNRALKRYGRDGPEGVEILPDDNALRAALEREFGIRLAAGTHLPVPD